MLCVAVLPRHSAAQQPGAALFPATFLLAMLWFLVIPAGQTGEALLFCLGKAFVPPALPGVYANVGGHCKTTRLKLTPLDGTCRGGLLAGPPTRVGGPLGCCEDSIHPAIQHNVVVVPASESSTPLLAVLFRIVFRRTILGPLTGPLND